eukprot:GFYU01005186.1.p1 GENE.GFYU01005186.1~~GFYU01005186.1.p1  ORF type:complete len:315 (-),score=67.19 GFYU01005186.1:370-1314(-)
MSKEVQEILKWKKELESLIIGEKNGKTEFSSDADPAISILGLLKNQPVSKEVLKKTSIHKVLAKLREHPNEEVSSKSTIVYKTWKRTFTEKDSKTPTKGSDKASDKATPPKPKSIDTDAPKIARQDSTGSALMSPQGVEFGEKPRPCGDNVRDKVRQQLYEALCRTEDEDARTDSNPGPIAEAIETCMFNLYKDTGKDYKTKFRSLSFNLKDPKNPSLRANVLLSIISPEKLCQMTSHEMASDDVKKEREEHQRIGKEKVMPDWDRDKSTTNMFKCGKCGERKCTYYQMQTRSADEPMTTFVTCQHCGNRWKFC